MSVLAKHLTKEILCASLFVLVALLGLFMFFDFVGHLGKIGTRYSLTQALMMTFFTLPARLYDVMPIAALLGGVYTLSRLAANSEFMIMRISGLSPMRLTAILALPALVLMLMTYLVGEFVAPQADKIRSDLRAVANNRSQSARGYSSGIWVKDVIRNENGKSAGVRFVNIKNLVAGRQSETRQWRVMEFDKAGNLLRIVHAPSAVFDPGRGWMLKNAEEMTVPVLKEDEGLIRDKASFERHPDYLLATSVRPTTLGVLTVLPEKMGIAELHGYIRHLKENKQETGRYNVAMWSRIFYPFAIFVMLIMAMPFAYLNTRSGGVSIKIFLGLMLGIGFYAFNNVFSFMGVLHTWPPAVVAVTPSLIMLCIALVAMVLVERR